MILFLSDVHCRYEIVNQQVAHAEQELGVAVSDVLVLGDFGLFEPFLKRFFRKRQERFVRPTRFIEGNHEDFDGFDRLVERYGDVITYLQRGTVHTIGDARVLAFGGVSYMDAHTTPERAEIRARDIDRCLALPPDSAEIVISHDCPAGIGVVNEPGFEHYGPTGFAGGDRIVSHFQPRLWVFGHHHRWFDQTVEDTRFFGLPQSWLGYALWEPDGGLRRIEHPLSEQTSRRRAFWRWFKRSDGHC